MAALAFREIFRKRTTGKDGDGTVVFEYSASDAAEVDAVAKLTNRFLSAMVVEESDVQEGVADQS